TKGDTLVYSKTLEANIPLFSMIKGGAYGVDQLRWEGLRANIIRRDTVTGYNFQFLIDAFAPSEETGTKTDTLNSQPLNLTLGQFKFKAIDIVFDDEVAGINSHFKIGSLDATLKKTSIETMSFDVKDITLKDANIIFTQKPIAIDTTTSEVPLPK